MILDDMITPQEEEKPLETLAQNGGFTAIFRKIAVIGDSLSSGEFESLSKSGVKGYHDYFEYSWGQNIARMCGSQCYNFSRGGMTAKEYCEGYADSMRFFDPQFASQCYIIALGVNDILNQNQEIGSIQDICRDDYTQNKKTFVGYYAEIIQHYKKIQPRAKFFLMTFVKESNKVDLRLAHRKALYDLAEYFNNTYVIDLYEYAPEYDDDFKAKFYMGGHLNPAGYVLTAHIVGSYIDYIIRHNFDDFKEVGYIGTDLSYFEE